ncbi:MAG: RNA polymerase factor sigma-54 [Candidatus Aminicenantes bacterium]|nr:RNA polymerase factor sigma-54 [Candidatus Aminicenantes bacterium]
MATRLSLKPSYQLTINPVIHSFIGFLPLNRTEFVDKIRNEVEANPMLDIETPAEETSKRDKEINTMEKRLERADSSFLNQFKEESFLKRDSDRLDKNRAIELFTASEVSLSDHLIEQAMSQFNKKELEIADQIIYNLNRDGYLDIEIESIASSMQTTPQEIDRIRGIIRTFDPCGVASRSLSECLLAQVEDTPENKNLRLLIENYLEELSKSKYDEIIKKLKIDRKELSMLINHLKRLDPKPGYIFEKESVDYAEVDLMLIKEVNEYTVRYIDEGIPRMVLSSYYEQMIDKSGDKKTKSYLKDRHRNAQLFIEGINLRKTMIVKIAEVLVKKQKDYLDFGEKWKKPLTMKEVAQELGYNESTISRSVSNKYIASEKGLISLKSFFSYGIKGEFGFKHSVETIRDKIKKIIEEEAKAAPLSDQDIAAKLTDLGIKISRRTIRNYRDEMNILNSSKRKEKYKLDEVQRKD